MIDDPLPFVQLLPVSERLEVRTRQHRDRRSTATYGWMVVSVDSPRRAALRARTLASRRRVKPRRLSRRGTGTATMRAISTTAPSNASTSRGRPCSTSCSIEGR